MSAYVDRSQPVTFYFGNAIVELSHLLPAEDDAPRFATASALEASSSGHENMGELVASLEARLDQLALQRGDLLFLLKDLRRLLPE